MKIAFGSGEKLLKKNFDQHDVIATHAELTTTCERVRKVSLVRKITAFHILDQINHLRLLDKIAAWRRTKMVSTGARYWLRDSKRPRDICIR